MLRFGLVILCAAAALTMPVDETPLLPGALPAVTSHRYVPFREMGERIINGAAATRGQFPWQAALYIGVSGGTSFCGGSLIRANTILSAAHCIQGATGVTAYFAVVSLQDTANRVTATASSAVAHGSYNANSLANDVSLIILSSSVSTSSTYISLITLGTSAVGGGVTVSVSGWGRTSDSSNSISQTLNYVSLSTITNAVCQNTYGTLNAGVLCAQGTNTASTCNGDSGGPLITGSGTSATQVGIVSFGSSQGCAVGYPVGFTRTATYASWIDSNAG